MKNLLAGALLLACLVFTAQGRYYHVYEELGEDHQSKLIAEKDPETASGRGNSVKWTENTVPLVISTNFTSAQLNVILAAMKDIENVSCVRFVPRDVKHTNYVYVAAEDSGCWADLGMQGGVQRLNLDPRGCIAKGLILHQLMHVLGFVHPTSRSDRDLYVQIRWNNVSARDKNKFDKEVPNDTVDGEMTYDYRSILHWPAIAYTGTGEPTIIPLHENIELGQRDELSAKDIRKINKKYPCIV